jgi:arylsulfatase A-like enzyme
VDQQVGRILSNLGSQAANTIIVFTADHGPWIASSTKAWPRPSETGRAGRGSGAPMGIAAYLLARGDRRDMDVIG